MPQKISPELETEAKINKITPPQIDNLNKAIQDSENSLEVVTVTRNGGIYQVSSGRRQDNVCKRRL